MKEKTTKGKKFVKDLGIYAIGNIGSKLITFLLVPFYTHYITNTNDYGYYELSMTISFCFIPLLCLQMTDGGFRLLLESKDNNRHKAIISYIAKVLLINTTAIIIISAITGIIHPIRFLPYIIAYGISQTFYEVTIQLVRGLGHIKTFVSAGISNAILTAILSITLLAGFGMGVEGIFIAAVAAKIITLTIINHKIKLTTRYINRKNINKSISKELLQYSIPLIPVALCWWFITANNQFFIERYLGLSDNGFYGLVCRFTGILYILCSIFYQTWQQNAIEQYNSPDRDSFFSIVFNHYVYLLCLMVTIFPFALRICYPWLVGEAYQESSRYLYLNSIYVMVFALSSFFEIGYQCAKRTSRILPSLILSACISIICNILLIKRFGINGAITSSIVTYLALLIYRSIDTRKYLRIQFFSHNIIPIILTITAYIYYQNTTSALNDLSVCIAALILYAILLPKDIKKTIKEKLSALGHSFLA